MNKLFKTILIGSIIISGIGFLFASPASANGTLVVEWSETGSIWLPLSGAIFNEANFMPGNQVTRYIRVTNNSGQPQRIAIEAINEKDSDNLSSQMNLVIKEGGTIFNDTLKKFFDQGETYLSDLAIGGTTIYELTITLNSGTDNAYQEKILGFDILVGFEGTEGELILPQPGQGTGSGLPAGLIIQNEASQNIDSTSAKISWYTTYKSTSRVIYDIVQGTLNLSTLPNYGYNYSTPELDTPADPSGVTYHEVWLTGLTPGTTYYFRVISHASPDTIGREFSFTTLSPEERKPYYQETIDNNIPKDQSAVFSSQGQGEGGGEVIAFSEEETSPEQEMEAEENTGPIILGEEPKEIESRADNSNFLASIASFFNFGNYCGYSTLIITILAVLYLLSKSRKKEIGEKKRYWDLIIATVVLVVLFFLLKCQLLIIPIIILIIYLFLAFLRKES